jgi:hypothetical protein
MKKNQKMTDDIMTLGELRDDMIQETNDKIAHYEA